MGIACIPNYEKSVFLNEIYNQSDKKEIFVECSYNKDFEKWEPVKECNRVDNISVLGNISP